MDKQEIVVTAEELSLVEDNSLNQGQLKHLLKSTPAKYKKTRPAKGGGQWEYVTGGYVKKVLNLMFGWDWDFEIIDHHIMLEAKEVVVKGKLTCRSNGKEIVKMQFGNKDIICRRDSGQPLSIGNDMKAAATDALKKCAAEIGIAADVYNKEEFKELNIVTNEELIDELRTLFTEKEELIPSNEIGNIQNIIDNQVKSSYSKAIKYLKQLK